MSFLLSGSTIRRPVSINEENSTLMAENRTLSGTVGRDFFGTNKRVFTLNFENCNAADFSTINTIYTTYLATGTTVTFQITDSSYNGYASTARSVHVDLLQRGFKTKGSDYLSEFSLVLKEA